ncbi:helix-turn-helix domain-containing protein [Propionibacterium acidifaciens]|uniref:helix-turn-helix domain-containing protein n=1 Tax=Propionibacterium acidifaciens TaxID=556499 RepID=UPI0023F3BB6F|nr:AraC family transcriptional regulator [Propionibacterium acidifaciens]
MPRGEGTALREGPIDPGGFEVEDAGLGLHAYVYDIGSYHFNWHEELELLTIVRGEIEVCAGGRARTCTSGEMTLINPHQGHATLALSAGARALAVHFSPHVLEGVTPDWPANRFASMPGDSPRQLSAQARVRAAVAALLLEPVTRAEEAFRLRADFYHMLAGIVEAFPLTEPGVTRARHDSGNAVIAKVCAHLEQHFTERITLAQLSRIGGYNESYLSELFTRTIGMSAFDYLGRLRVRAAARQLAETRDRISDVALANGFPDAKALDTAFRRWFDKSPSAYRRHIATGPAAAEIAVVDAGFKKRFVPRADDDVRRLLTDWYEIVRSPRRRSAELAGLRTRADQLADAAADLARRLNRLEQ